MNASQTMMCICQNNIMNVTTAVKVLKVVIPLRDISYLFIKRKSHTSVICVKLVSFSTGSSRSIWEFTRWKQNENVITTIMIKNAHLNRMVVSLLMKFLNNANSLKNVKRLSANIGTDTFIVKSCVKRKNVKIVYISWFLSGLDGCKFSSWWNWHQAVKKSRAFW